MEQQTWEPYIQREDHYEESESEESDVESSEESDEIEVERVRYRRRRSLTPPRARSSTNRTNERACVEILVILVVAYYVTYYLSSA